MKKLTFFCAAAFLAANLSAQLGMGDVAQGSSKVKLKTKNISSMGFSGTLPSAFSLKNYAPYAKSQDAYGTCVSWATSYSALTIQYAIANKLTNRNIITSLAFCPFYLHNNIKPVKDTCSGGNNMFNAVINMQDLGVKRYYLPLIGCGTPNNSYMTDAAKNFKCNAAYQIYYYEGNSPVDEATTKEFFAREKFDIEKVKTGLNLNIVPIFGMYVPKSFQNINGGLWELSESEKADPVSAILSQKGFQHQRHCMTIVSYDDNKYGGAFEIMNSWGTSFGNNGFVWVRYADLQKFVHTILWMETGFTAPTLTSGCVSGDCNNGYGMYKGTNGDFYEGFFKNGKFHGYGVYGWASGMTYAGAFKDGMRHGDAMAYYADGSFGGVTYKDDKFVSGYDKVTYTDGSTYIGTKKNGELDGYGTLKLASGSSYEGGFVAGEYSGLGVYTFANGTVHYGYFLENKRHGKGLEITTDGKIWAGDWSYDKFATGSKYGFASGNFSNLDDLSYGFNINYVDASCASGDCLGGVGVRKFSDGTTYEGGFRDGVEHGPGKTTYKEGWSVETFFDDGLENWGEFVKVSWSNGNSMMGKFVNGKWDGYCAFFDASGNPSIRRFTNGEYVTVATANNNTYSATNLQNLTDKVTTTETLMSTGK